MFRRKGLAMNAAVAAAAYAALACGSLVRASDVDASGATAASASATTSSANSSNPFSFNLSSQAASDQPLLLQDQAGTTAPPTKPLASILNYTPLGKPLGNLGISVSGYVEGSWTYAAPPSEHYIVGRAYDYEPQSILLNNVDLLIARGVDTTANKFDIGATVEATYGADSALNHSNGMSFYSPSKILGAYYIGAGRFPKNQFDILQGFVTAAIPVGNGIGVTVGKFYPLVGYEVDDGPLNPFYSHSFLFTQLPITQTGALISYNLTKEITLTAGSTRGWNQTFNDDNGDWDVTGQLKYAKDKVTAFLNYSGGNQNPNAGHAIGYVPGIPGQDGWLNVIDGILTYNYSDNLTLTLNGDYGWWAQRDAGGTAQWYGVAGYASYQISSQFTLNLRAEWFDDQDGAAPFSFDPGVPNQYDEISANLKITPFPNNAILSNLVFRPEVRYDYSSHSVFGGGGNEHSQLTAAIEGYFTF